MGKGIPFRDAYGITGALVRTCVDKGITLEDLSIEDYKAVNPVFDEGIYDAIDLLNCVNRRKLAGGPAPEAVAKQIANVEKKIEE